MAKQTPAEQPVDQEPQVAPEGANVAAPAEPEPFVENYATPGFKAKVGDTLIETN